MKRVAFILVAGLALMGCQGRSLVGTWDASGLNYPGLDQNSITFNGDGTSKFIIAGDVSNMKIEINIDGKWTQTGDSITVSMDNLEVVNAPEAFKNQIKVMADAQMKKSLTGKLQWVDDKQVSIVGEGVNLQLKKRP